MKRKLAILTAIVLVFAVGISACGKNSEMKTENTKQEITEAAGQNSDTEEKLQKSSEENDSGTEKKSGEGKNDSGSDKKLSEEDTTDNNAENTESSSETEAVSSEQLLMDKIDQLTLEQKVAQMFFITPEALTGVGTVTAAGDASREAYEKYPVGGLIYFASNFSTPEQTGKMLSNMQSYAEDIIGMPVFLSVDEEGGKVIRIASNSNFQVPKFDYLSQMGQRGSTEEAYQLGNGIGSYLANLGFNMDFAPVADVLSNSSNTVVKDRSFGSDAALVSSMDLNELKGLEDAGVTGVYKHFPGHGGTTGDTHAGYSYINSTLDELMNGDLIPFRDGIEAGLKVVMVGHISCPNITGNDTPAVLSSQITTDLLRNQLGFDGIAVTDALNMGAVTQRGSSGTIAVEAVNAGIDMLLMPQNFQDAYQGILNAVQAGTITEERINESVYRIWKVKQGL